MPIALAHSANHHPSPLAAPTPATSRYRRLRHSCGYASSAARCKLTPARDCHCPALCPCAPPLASRVSTPNPDTSHTLLLGSSRGTFHRSPQPACSSPCAGPRGTKARARRQLQRCGQVAGVGGRRGELCRVIPCVAGCGARSSVRSATIGGSVAFSRYLGHVSAEGGRGGRDGVEYEAIVL